MWLLTSEQEAWLRDSLKGEPEWLQRMVLEDFGIYPPDPPGVITMRSAMRALTMLYAPPQTPADDPFGNPRLDTTLK